MGGFRKGHERKKHPKKICIKNFGGTLAGGSRRGLRRPNSLCRCWFSQQNTVHKEFRGGGLRGSWGWGLRSNFGAPFLYVYVLFWGLKGGFSNNRFVLKPDVAIASEVSILSKNSLSITDFHAKKTQHVQLLKTPFLEPPPFAIPNRPEQNPEHTRKDSASTLRADSEF